jgi:flagellar FliJ protein
MMLGMMKMRFKYPLQKVVNLKKTEKSNAEMLLARAMGHLRLVEMSLTDLEREWEEVQQLMLECASQPTSVSALITIQDYLAHLEQCIQRKQIEAQEAQIEVENKQVFLTEKTVDEKVWLKTKERAYVKFATFMQRKEQNELDEIALRRGSSND